MEHLMMAVRCDTAKCIGTGDAEKEIRVWYIPEPQTQAQTIPCPYCGAAIERNIPGKVMKVTPELRNTL